MCYNSINRKAEQSKMDNKILQKIKKKLEFEVQKLEKNLSGFKKFPYFGSSSEDNAEGLETFSENVDLSKKFRVLLKEAKTALKRIEEDKYGICVKCKKEISYQRLKAYPSAIFCVECESKGSRRWWQLFKK